MIFQSISAGANVKNTQYSSAINTLQGKSTKPKWREQKISEIKQTMVIGCVLLIAHKSHGPRKMIREQHTLENHRKIDGVVLFLSDHDV